MLPMLKKYSKFAYFAFGAFATIKAQAQASTAITANLNVSLSITATCTVTGGTLPFGISGLLTGLLPATGTFTVTCTNTTPYTMGLNQGVTGATVTTRQLHSATTSANVNYGLYSDIARTVNWGNTVGSWVSGVGTGSAQTVTVYGLVPLQTTPAPATDYTDTITITVTY
jgi:spore coat protein U-like protein